MMLQVEIQDLRRMLKEKCEEIISDKKLAYEFYWRICEIEEDDRFTIQETVEPILIREGRNKNYNDYVCPRCDNEVVYEQNYCSECGVQFLWEGR